METGLILLNAVLMAAVVYILIRIGALKEKIELLESAIRRLAPKKDHVGGRAIRFSVQLNAIIKVEGKQHPVVIKDLSTSGAQLQAPVHLQVGQVITLELSGSEKVAGTDAKIMRVVSPGVFGMQFQSPSLAFRKLLKVLRDRAIMESSRQMTSGPGDDFPGAGTGASA